MLRSLPRSIYVPFIMNLSDETSLATNRNQIEFEMLHTFTLGNIAFNLKEGQ